MHEFSAVKIGFLRREVHQLDQTIEDFDRCIKLFEPQVIQGSSLSETALGEAAKATMDINPTYSDEDSSLDAPPPPPPAEVEDARHEEQLKIFQGMAEFDNSGNDPNQQPKPGEDGQSDASLEQQEQVGDDLSVEIPPPPGLIERNSTPQKPGDKDKKKPMAFGACALCLLLVIVVVLAVGFGTGAFTKSGKDVAVETPKAAAPSASPPDDGPTDGSSSDAPAPTPAVPPSDSAVARTDRVRSYLASVTALGDDTFADSLSPEARALTWLQEEDPLQLDPIEFESHYRLEQRFALLSIWFQSDFAWFDETNWRSEDECTWKGVTCQTASPDLRRRNLQEGDQVVTGLDLTANNVQGVLPADIGLLQYLETLDLSENNLAGPVPASIGNLEFLQELKLNSNRFSGDLDNLDFSGLTDLVTINLQSNEMSGSIPASIFDLPQLRMLWLNDNKFSGQLPNNIAFATQLETLDLSKNELSGELPQSIGDLEGIQSLLLSDNKFEGQIPAEIGDLVNVMDIMLDKNKFTGQIPDFSNIQGLQILRLGENNFDEQSFPEELFGIESLIDLRLNDCNLVGPLSNDIGDLDNLVSLHLQYNALSGDIPVGISFMEDLIELSLHNNLFDGEFPFELTVLDNLESLSLSNNFLNSTIPDAIGGLESLKYLILSNNFFYGELPDSVSFLANLEILDLSENEFSGPIPDDIGNLALLRELVLETNSFDNVPDSIVNLGNLEVLDLSNNVFNGRLPDGFVAGLQNLVVLNLSKNFFADQIPADIGSLTRLIELRLNTNFAAPFFGFRGPIPASLGLLENLIRLDLNENRLTGELPAEIGFLNTLQLFNVGFNPDLGGEIPAEFENLVNMKAFYITGTGVAGTVPGALCDTDAFIEVDCSDAIQCDCCVCYDPDAE